MMRNASVASVLTTLFSSTIVKGFTVVNTIESTLGTNSSAEYKCRFQNKWSATDHPNDYPSSSHWSPPVLVSHNSSYQMWAPGILSSPGVKLVAETGSTGTLRSEISDSLGTGNVIQGQATFNSQTQEQSFSSLTFDAEHPLLTTITMIAPSPDWFSGFYDFSTVAESNGNWFRSFTVESVPWDAGTDSGDTYLSSNSATNPPEDIFVFTAETVPESSGVFLSTASEVLPVILWTCELENENSPSDPPSGARASTPLGFLGGVWLIRAFVGAII